MAGVRSATFDLPDRKVPEAVSLGVFEPSAFRLRYLLLVSLPERAFVLPSNENLNVIDAVFREFRLTVLWNYSPFPSNQDGLHTGWESVPGASGLGLDYWSEPFQITAFRHFAQQGVDQLLAPLYPGHPWLDRSSRHGIARMFALSLHLRQLNDGPLLRPSGSHRRNSDQ